MRLRVKKIMKFSKKNGVKHNLFDSFDCVNWRQREWHEPTFNDDVLCMYLILVVVFLFAQSDMFSGFRTPLFVAANRLFELIIRNKEFYHRRSPNFFTEPPSVG